MHTIPEPANLDNLVPALKEMLDDGLIMPAMARNLSTMTNEGQQAWVSHKAHALNL